MTCMVTFPNGVQIPNYEKYYEKSPYLNPKGPDEGKQELLGINRVLRGGSFFNSYSKCNSISRFQYKPKSGWCDCGFRCVQDIAK